MGEEKGSERLWWKHGVVYHIYIRSFYDTNGDGIGDIPGIISKLPYLSDLGVEAIWLSPVFTSPNFDFGYDVSDFSAVHTEFGTLENLRILIEEAHRINIHIILDLVLNHTSDQHPWFLESKSSLHNPKRDWYIWKEGKNNRPPNNWKSATGGSAWKFDPHTQEYFFHSFFPEQPDLNWRNKELEEECFRIIQYWLDMGVDGFRLDVINLIVKDKKFRNNPQFPLLPFFQQHLYTRNRNKSYRILKRLRRLLDSYENKMSVGEVYVMPPGDAKMAASYLGKGTNSLHLAFDFSLIFTSWNAHQYYKAIINWHKLIPKDGWPCYVLSNHDLFRSIDRIPWRTYKAEKAKVTAVLLLTLRGTPFIYYGEEIGMQNSRIPRKALRDPFGKKYWPFFSGRDKARTPMQWDDSPNAGFSKSAPWLPVDPGYRKVNVKSEYQDESSIFHVYRSMIHLRRIHPALQRGQWVGLLDGKQGVLVFQRQSDEECLLVVLNFTSRKVKIDLPEYIRGYVLFSTHRKIQEVLYLQDKTVFPFEATVLVQL